MDAYARSKSSPAGDSPEFLSFAKTSVIYLSTFYFQHISETMFQVVSRYFIGVAD